MDIQQNSVKRKDRPGTAAPSGRRRSESESPGASEDAPRGAGGPGPRESVDEYEQLGDFGATLDKWEAGLRTLREGDVVEGTVLKVLEKEVIVDIGYKSEGVIDIQEFRGADGTFHVKSGDRVDVLLEKTEDSDGYVVLSKDKAERLKVWDFVERAYETGEPIVGRVVDRIKGGLKVDIGLPAFLPGSLVDVRPVRNLDALKGQEFRMRAIKVNRRRGNIVLSRKAVLEEENAEKKKKTLEELAEGRIIRGAVKNLTEYGAFVDLGGIDGLLHVTDMSWGRVGHPSEKFQIGDEVDVVVLKFDRERERVSLGFKQLQEDPWDSVPTKYPLHARIRGKVVSLTDYGAFVELEEGIEGLIHVSEMSWTKRVKHPSKILSVGDWVECVVLDVEREARRLSLGLKQTEPNPWELINTKYRVGDRITGTVRNITDFGAFVEVEEGIDGLVHISDLSWTRRIKHPGDVLVKGQSVEAVILKIDSENQRLSLGIKQLQPNVLDDFFHSHRVGDALTGKIVRLTEFGAFVELFPDVEGLVHVSEMAHARIERPEDSFRVGQEVRVRIIKMDPVEKKIGLSIKAALDGAGPEDAVEATPPRGPGEAGSDPPGTVETAGIAEPAAGEGEPAADRAEGEV
jgi:small subunit ribosomal protein S1